MCNYPDTEHGTSSTRTHTQTHTHVHILTHTRNTHTHSGKIGSTKSSLGKSWRAVAVACVCVCVSACANEWVNTTVYMCVCGLGVGVAALCCCRLCCYWHGKLTIFQLKSIPSAFFVGGRQWACQGWVIYSAACVCKCVSVWVWVWCVSCVSVCCVLLCTFHENSLSAWKYATHATSGRLPSSVCVCVSVCGRVRQSVLVHVSVFACVCVRACLSLLLLVFWGRLRCLQVNF